MMPKPKVIEMIMALTIVNGISGSARNENGVDLGLQRPAAHVGRYLKLDLGAETESVNAEVRQVIERLIHLRAIERRVGLHRNR